MSVHSTSAPGYRVPMIDLAFDLQRHFVVDREQGQYLGHPTTVLLDDLRTILAVYPKGHGKGVIVMKKSLDGGLTWSERLPTPDNWDTSQETPTLYKTVDRHGKSRLILFSGGLIPVRMAVSEDQGETWSPLRPIGTYSGVVAMADLIRLKDGRHMAFFHGMNYRFVGDPVDPTKLSPDYLACKARAAGQTPRSRVDATGETRRIFKITSDDGGLTWSEPTVATEIVGLYICEPGVFRSPDGNQLAMLLRENSRRKNSFVSVSDDEGETWSTPRELPAALTGDRHQGCYLPDGRLFISFRDTTRESLTKGDWVGWVGTYADIVQGREGQYRLRIMKNYHNQDCAYPAVERLPDGTIVTLTYGHWTMGQPPYIAGVRFTTEELDAMPKWVWTA